MNAFSRRLHVPAMAVMALLLHVRAASFKFLPELAWGEIKSYPWSDTSPNVRVAKALLPHLDIQGAKFNLEEPPIVTVEFDDRFVHAFRLTTNEISALRSLVTNVWQQIKLEEPRHLHQIDTPGSLWGYSSPSGLKVLEQMTFELEPYPKALSRIDDQAHRSVEAILDQERAAHFWSLSPALTGPLRRFVDDDSFAPPNSNQTTLTYRLIEFQGARSVDLVTVTQTRQPGAGSGGGTSGGPFAPGMDPYVPESLKPVLKKWRASIAEFSVEKPASTTPAPPSSAARTPLRKGTPSTKSSQSATRPSPLWDPAAAFVDIPKDELPALGISGLNEYDEVPVAVATLLDLPPERSQAVSALYGEFRQRFEGVEKAQLRRDPSDDTKFILRAFPEETMRLQAEWLERLKALVGADRAAWLDTMIRTPAEWARVAERAIRRLNHFPRYVTRWNNWFTRGVNEVRFTLKMDHLPPARSRGSIRYEVVGAESQSSNEWDPSNPSSNGPWNHIFTAYGDLQP